MDGPSPKLIEKIDNFLSNPDTRIFTGARRTEADELLDMLADRIIARNASANLIRIEGNVDTASMNRIRSEMDPIKENDILLYGLIRMVDLQTIMESFPYANIFRAQELCHQTPACIRESANR